MVIIDDCAPMSELGKSQTDRKRIAQGNILAYLEHNRGKPQYRHAPSAAMATNRILRPLSKKFGPGKNALQNHWPQIIGEKWAALSRPMAIRGGKTGKSLLIEAKGPAAALIQANAGQLLGKINQFLGKDTITKIIVKQGSMKPNTQTAAKTTAIKTSPEQQPSSVKNNPENAFQTALDNLGKKVHTRTTEI